MLEVNLMVISAVVDRIEDGNAILLSEGIGIEISIPVNSMDYTYNKGDMVSLSIDNDTVTTGLSRKADNEK
jgi:hypothetical protein